MERYIFIESERLLFSKWIKEDVALAKQLWGNCMVSQYICATGVFTIDEILARLKLEIENEQKYGIQYWPVFTKDFHFVGCCGLRPHGENEYEIGFHFLPEYWHQGYAKEAAKRVMNYAFGELGAKRLFAGHNPENDASRKTLTKLGFIYTHDEFYEPTGLMHPSYKYARQRKQELSDE